MNKEECIAVEEYAKAVRANYDVKVPFFESIDYLLEKLGGNLEITELDCFGSSKLYLRTAIWEELFTVKVKPSVSREKRNYEIAKQIGHLFLHTTYVNAMTEGKPLLITDDLSDTVNEAQANIFADTLVMPQDEFTKEVKQNVHDGRADMKKVAKKFGVTYDRALVRASRLNLIEW